MIEQRPTLKKLLWTSFSLTAATVTVAAAFDFQSGQKFEQDVAHHNTDVMTRFNQCRAENSLCETDLSVLNACLAKKADEKQAEINNATNIRDEEKIAFRRIMLGGSLYCGVLWLMMLRTRKNESDPQPPLPKP